MGLRRDPMSAAILRRPVSIAVRFSANRKARFSKKRLAKPLIWTILSEAVMPLITIINTLPNSNIPLQNRLVRR
jgi:hypothetical protein